MVGAFGRRTASVCSLQPLKVTVPSGPPRKHCTPVEGRNDLHVENMCVCVCVRSPPCDQKRSSSSSFFYLQDRDFFALLRNHESDRTRLWGSPRVHSRTTSFPYLYTLSRSDFLIITTSPIIRTSTTLNSMFPASSHEYSPLLLLRNCQIGEWMCQNYLQLNAKKTEAIISLAPLMKGQRSALTLAPSH